MHGSVGGIAAEEEFTGRSRASCGTFYLHRERMVYSMLGDVNITCVAWDRMTVEVETAEAPSMYSHYSDGSACLSGNLYVYVHLLTIPPLFMSFSVYANPVMVVT